MDCGEVLRRQCSSDETVFVSIKAVFPISRILFSTADKEKYHTSPFPLTTMHMGMNYDIGKGKCLVDTLTWNACFMMGVCESVEQQQKYLNMSADMHHYMKL